MSGGWCGKMLGRKGRGMQCELVKVSVDRLKGRKEPEGHAWTGIA